MLGFIAYATTYVYGTLITAAGRMRILNILAFGGVILNIVLNFILIPQYGAYGSAVATLVSQIIAATTQFISAKSIFKLRTNWRLIAGLILFSSSTVLLSYWMVSTDLSWIQQTVVVIIVGMGIAWASGLLPFKQLQLLIKSRLSNG
jgi:O-antigen/teichoic acid export membrane protein